MKRSHANRTSQVVGVDVGQSHLLVLSVETKGGQCEITHFRLEPRPPSNDALSERLRQIFQEETLSSKKVRTVLKGQGVVIRFLTFPQMKREDFASAIRYEIEKYIPFKIDEIILDFQILNENIVKGDTVVMEVLLVAAKQSEVYQHLRLFQNAEIEPKLVDVNAFAISNFIEFVSPKTKDIPTGFLDLGAETATLGVLVNGKPIFIREISFGGSDILKLLKRKLGLGAEAAMKVSLDPSSMNPDYRLIVDQGLESLITELKLSLGYYSDHVAGAVAIQTLLLFGGGSRFISNLEDFSNKINVSVQRPEIFSKIETAAHLNKAMIKSNEDLLPAVLGLCLRP